jgi:hypothetical protein
METVDVKAITLAKPQEKLAIARHAWEQLPPTRRKEGNLAVLQNAIAENPVAFLQLCRQEGLPVIVFNHTTEHHHHHGSSLAPGGQTERHHHHGSSLAPGGQEGGLTAADVLAIVQAAQPPQQASTGVSEMMAMVAQQQQRSDALLAAMMAQSRHQPAPHIEINPNISVNVDVDDNYTHPGGVVIIAGLFFGILFACVAGK